MAARMPGWLAAASTSTDMGSRVNDGSAVQFRP